MGVGSLGTQLMEQSPAVQAVSLSSIKKKGRKKGRRAEGQRVAGMMQAERRNQTELKPKGGERPKKKKEMRGRKRE